MWSSIQSNYICLCVKVKFGRDGGGGGIEEQSLHYGCVGDPIELLTAPF